MLDPVDRLPGSPTGAFRRPLGYLPQAGRRDRRFHTACAYGIFRAV